MTHKALSRLFLGVFCLGVILTVPALADENLPQDAGVSAGLKDSGKIWSGLGLSQEQSKQINDIRRKFTQQALTLKQQIASVHLELSRQLAAPASNPARLDALLQQQIALQSQLQKASLDSFVAMKKVLTDQQRVALQRALILAIR